MAYELVMAISVRLGGILSKVLLAGFSNSLSATGGLDGGITPHVYGLFKSLLARMFFYNVYNLMLIFSYLLISSSSIGIPLTSPVLFINLYY